VSCESEDLQGITVLVQASVNFVLAVLFHIELTTTRPAQYRFQHETVMGYFAW
jgi:hypothetical protein